VIPQSTSCSFKQTHPPPTLLASQCDIWLSVVALSLIHPLPIDLQWRAYRRVKILCVVEYSRQSITRFAVQLKWYYRKMNNSCTRCDIGCLQASFQMHFLLHLMTTDQLLGLYKVKRQPLVNNWYVIKVYLTSRVLGEVPVVWLVEN
jgi:hypothetical protein